MLVKNVSIFERILNFQCRVSDFLVTSLPLTANETLLDGFAPSENFNSLLIGKSWRCTVFELRVCYPEQITSITKLSLLSLSMLVESVKNTSVNTIAADVAPSED